MIRKTFWNSSSQQKNHLVTCFPNNPIRKKTSASFFSFLHASEFSFDICLALLHACLLACCIPLQKKCLWKWASFYKLNNGLEIKTNRLSIKEFFPLLNGKVFLLLPNTELSYLLMRMTHIEYIIILTEKY